MKTLIVFFAITCITATTVYSQNLSVGPFKGFGHSIVSVKDHSQSGLGQRFYPSFTIGGKFIYSFVSNWGISGGVNFSHEGGRLKGTLGPNEVEYTYDANYIRIPVQGIYFFGKLGDRVRPKLAAGPSIGFLVGGTSTSGMVQNIKLETNTKDIFEDVDMGITGSAGINFRIVKDIWLNSDITYYHGLTDINSSGPGSFRNRSLQMMMGVTFPLGTIKPR
jgi:hypothetical protein